MDEREMFLGILQRLVGNGGIERFYECTNKDKPCVEIDSVGWHGYAIRIYFDKDGNVTTINAGT